MSNHNKNTTGSNIKRASKQRFKAYNGSIFHFSGSVWVNMLYIKLKDI